VIGHPRQRKPLAPAELARGQRDAKNRRDPLGILTKRLIEVAEPEEDDGIGVFAFDPQVLLENRARLQRRA
jgi:hypothetical protein